jgi:hypothetical protein
MVAMPPVRSASTFVVLSGGPIGAAATGQLLRAIAARRLRAGRIVVVDKDEGCAAAALVGDRVELAVADWVDWLDAHLDGLPADAQLVPYHWAPHVLVHWLSRQVERAGGRAFRGGDLPGFSTPVDRPTRDGDRALSYATWICPPTCIEPALCPHTRGPKDWSLARDLEEANPAAFDLDGRLVFRCLHFVWGVGTVPVSGIRAARDRVLAGLRRGPRRYLVATSSHCHALATCLAVSAPAPG